MTNRDRSAGWGGALSAAVALMACGGAAPSPRTAAPARAADETTAPSATAARSPDVDAAAPFRCTSTEGAPDGDADPDTIEVVRALTELARSDPGALGALVDWDFIDRYRAIATDGEAAPVTRTPAELATLLTAEVAGCTPVLVTGELRMDLAPPMVDTAPAVAREIDDVRGRLYEGQEVTAYCGACPLHALLYRERDAAPPLIVGYLDLRATRPGLPD